MIDVSNAPRFVADCHLGKLAKYLRLMGYDTLYFTQIDDNDLIRIANDEGRIILTRDKELSERKKAPCTLLHATKLDKQLKELLKIYRLAGESAPFSRCIVCNTPLEPIDKASVLERIPAKVANYFDRFEICRECDRIYWHGDHYKKMKKYIEKVFKSG